MRREKKSQVGNEIRAEQWRAVTVQCKKTPTLKPFFQAQKWNAFAWDTTRRWASGKDSGNWPSSHTHLLLVDGEAPGRVGRRQGAGEADRVAEVLLLRSIELMRSATDSCRGGSSCSSPFSLASSDAVDPVEVVATMSGCCCSVTEVLSSNTKITK